LNGTNTNHLKNGGRISQFRKSGFVTKFEASKALRAAMDQQANGIAHRDDTRTLAEYLNYWLDNHAALRC